MRIVLALGIIAGAGFVYLTLCEIEYRKYWRRRP